MTLKRVITQFCFIVLLTSCSTTDKISYFQNIDEKALIESSEAVNNYEVKIAKDDQLSILVTSVDPNSVAVFNLPLASFLSPGEKEVSSIPSIQTYLVDNEGCIDFPVLGRLQVAGMTRSELSTFLRTRIAKYAKNPIVNVRIQNFKISILGEVNRPSTYTIYNERISILDALSLAGDLTIYGNRNNVLIIRDSEGKKEYKRIDLTSSDLFASPYFYLQQNDVLYVEPNDARKKNAKYNSTSQFNVSIASTVVSVLSVIASLSIALFIK